MAEQNTSNGTPVKGNVSHSHKKRHRRKNSNKKGAFQKGKGQKGPRRHGNKKHGTRPEDDRSPFYFLIKDRKDDPKFFSEDDLKNEEFGYQKVEDQDPLEYRQIYKIMHGREGEVELPENKDDYAGQRGPIVHYCKDCEKIIEPKKHPKKKYLFLCSECNGDNVSWGTEEGIKGHFRIKK